eukprot:m.473030 g.473030  ORF g.473030 m.473030 type:complete len:163 (-) comp20387_c0_seq20:2611-3099(-)
MDQACSGTDDFHDSHPNCERCRRLGLQLMLGWAEHDESFNAVGEALRRGDLCGVDDAIQASYLNQRLPQASRDIRAALLRAANLHHKRSHQEQGARQGVADVAELQRLCEDAGVPCLWAAFETMLTPEYKRQRQHPPHARESYVTSALLHALSCVTTTWQVG